LSCRMQLLLAVEPPDHRKYVYRCRHIGSAPVGLEVRAVTGAKELKRFIELPYRLHANHPLWVPPLRLERRMFLSRRMNAFFTHGEAEYFLARRDGRVAGRITAQVNHSFNDYQKKSWGWFGFLEFEDDPEVLDALLGA